MEEALSLPSLNFFSLLLNSLFSVTWKHLQRVGGGKPVLLRIKHHLQTKTRSIPVKIRCKMHF